MFEDDAATVKERFLNVNCAPVSNVFQLADPYSVLVPYWKKGTMNADEFFRDTCQFKRIGGASREF